jgi:uncharacterized cupin superfamily protein
MSGVNINDLDFDFDEDDDPGFATGMVRLDSHVGAERVGATIYLVPPAQAVSPYHYENGEEEWIMVLEGRPTLRTPAGERQLAPGALECFPSGPDGAHQLWNATEETVKILTFSNREPYGSSVYPDSDKVHVWMGDDPHLMLRRSEDLDYFDGEQPPVPQPPA